MNLPNKLTMLRIILIPVMIILYYIPWLRDNVIFCEVTWLFFLEFIIFFIAGFTDFFDGAIARKNNLITTFGKFTDPLADKMLVFSAMAILMVTQTEKSIFENLSSQTNFTRLIPVWMYVVMIIREFMVSGIRMLAAERGDVIAAGKLGKWKTAITMIAIGVLFFYGLHISILIIGQVLITIACVLTILSGIEYLWKNRRIVFESI